MNERGAELWDRGAKKRPCIPVYRLMTGLLALQVKEISCDICGAEPGKECTGFLPAVDYTYPMLHWGRVCKYKEKAENVQP